MVNPYSFPPESRATDQALCRLISMVTRVFLVASLVVIGWVSWCCYVGWEAPRPPVEGNAYLEWDHLRTHLRSTVACCGLAMPLKCVAALILIGALLSAIEVSRRLTPGHLIETVIMVGTAFGVVLAVRKAVEHPEAVELIAAFTFALAMAMTASGLFLAMLAALPARRRARELMHQAKRALHGNDPGRAIDLLEASLGLKPDSRETLELLGRTHEKLGQRDGAEIAFAAAAKVGS